MEDAALVDVVEGEGELDEPGEDLLLGERPLAARLDPRRQVAADAVAVVGSVTTEAEAEAKVPTSKSTDATDACDTASSSVFFGRSFRASAAAPRQMAAGSTQ